MGDPELSLDVYAAVLADIATGRARHEVLAAHGITEDAFGALERSVEEEFSKAMAHEGDTVPPFFQAYEAAIRRAQEKTRTGEPPSLEQFARGVAAIQRPGDPVRALERLGLKPADIVQALGHWGQQLAKDPEIAARFEAIRSGKKK
jgi:hypothetical protein